MTTVRVKSEPSVKRKMKPRGKPFAGRNDPRVNLNGAPKRGESWREIIDSVGKMFAEEISAEVGNNDLGRAYRQLPRGIAMKRLVVMRIFTALMFEPTAGLWNPLMERVEGKVIQPIDITIWQRDYAEAIRQGTLTLAALTLHFGHDGTMHILSDIVSGGYMTADEVQERLNVKLLADGLFKQQVTLGNE